MPETEISRLPLLLVGQVGKRQPRLSISYRVTRLGGTVRQCWLLLEQILRIERTLGSSPANVGARSIGWPLLPHCGNCL